MMISLLLSSFLMAAEAQTPSCVDLYCANAEKLNWHPCTDRKPMKSLQFHELTRGEEKVQVCALSTGSAANPESTVFSVRPYNLPQGTKLVSVDPKSWVVRLEAEFPSELYKETARDLSVPEGTKNVTFFYCKTTNSFSAFCPTEEQVKGTGTSESRPLRAYLTSGPRTFLLNAKGIFSINANGKKEDQLNIDASYRSKYYGQYGEWRFFGIINTDGEALTTDLIAFSESQRYFVKIITFTEFDFSIENAPEQGLLLRFKVPNEYEGAGTGRQLAKDFDVCPKGKLPAELDKPFEMILNAKPGKDLKLRSCEASPGK